MKKSKIILAIALAIAIVVTCISVPTFSWFSRPHSQDGEKTVIGGSNGTYSLNAYNGYRVSASTYASNDGVNYSTDATTNYSGSDIPNNNRKYFCTTLTNNSDTDKNVSLYARTLSIPTDSNNGTLALGVNSPTRNYRDYSALATPTTYSSQDSMRIYFQKPKIAPDGWAGTEFYICWGDNLDSVGSNGTYYKMTYCGEKDNYYNYYADIPMTAKQAFFACENWGEGKKEQDYTSDNWKKRTQTMTNLYSDGQTQLQSVVYQLTSEVSGGNTRIGNHYNVQGACINHYYNTIFVATGNTFNAALSNTTNIPTRSGYSANYIGTLKYYSSDENVFEIVDQNGQKSATGGYVKAVGAGEAILYTKSTGGSYPDSQQVETTVKVTAAANYVFNDVPIVRNVFIEGHEQNEEPKEVKVYWYVMNNSTTNALSYTIDEVYVGL